LPVSTWPKTHTIGWRIGICVHPLVLVSYKQGCQKDNEGFG
jgi:hypothetical protein